MKEIDIEDLKRVSDALNESRNIDFSGYAFSSFKRRISRFIEINRIRDFDTFIDRIKSDHSFADYLISEITVNVTEMFRDPSFWIVLQELILPQICRNRVINIWHAACSTGEEVYSMAILLEEAELLKHTKIVATDINNKVLETARRGIYPLKDQERNSKNYEQFMGKCKLSDYYTVNDGYVQYDKQLTENVDFRCHNLAQDGPFSTFDLILCRNVLIYFNFDLQEKVIGTFSKSMSKDSFLGIGSKESIRWCRSYRFFDEECYEEKIYRKTVEKQQYCYPGV